MHNSKYGDRIVADFMEIYQNLIPHWSTEELDSHLEVFWQGFLSGNRFTLEHVEEYKSDKHKVIKNKKQVSSKSNG